MLNFDSSLQYLKPITLINPKPEAAKKNTCLFLYYFFPEGDIIQNVNCRIAFKATDDEGVPAVVSSTLTDSKNKIITSFHQYMMEWGCLVTPVF